MHFEEEFNDSFIAELRGVIEELNGFGVSSVSTANGAVGRRTDIAANVA